jgi:kynureninase
VLGSCGDRVELLTPSNPEARGAQLSFRLRLDHASAEAIPKALGEAGVVGDWRAPDVLRLAPVPLYNRFADVHAGAKALCTAVSP